MITAIFACFGHDEEWKINGDVNMPFGAFRVYGAEFSCMPFRVLDGGDLCRGARASFVFMKKTHALVLLATLVAAGWLYHNFLESPRALWNGLLHDRHSHYSYGLDLAESVEHGQIIEFVKLVALRARSWPPVDGLLVMLTQVATGNDWRAAALASLAGWVLTLVCSWWLAQKIAAPTGAGVAGGLVALVLAALSPAGRLYATDSMLEALGAGLTMLALAFYAEAVTDRDSVWKWRGFAITLTLLFFEKYNYWILAVASIAVWHAWPFLYAMLGCLRKVEWKKTALGQLIQPMNWAVLLAATAVVVIFLRGNVPVNLFGRAVSIYPPVNAITAAYALFFIRMAMLIRRLNWRPLHAWNAMLWRWHVLPVSVSFLIPRRLGEFISYQSPSTYATSSYYHPFLLRIPLYWNGFLADYCPAPWIGLLAVALACVAASQLRRLDVGSRAVIGFCLIAGTLTILHTNNQGRFIHTWIPALWTSAGIGASMLLGRIKTPFRVPATAAAVALLTAAGGCAAWTLPPLRANTASDLDYSDAWLPELADSRNVAFVATQPSAAFISWTFKQRYNSAKEFDRPAWQYETSPEKMQTAFNAWLADTPTDTIVVFCISPQSPSFVQLLDEPMLREGVEDLMASQVRFRLARHIDFGNRGCTAEIWRLVE